MIEKVTNAWNYPGIILAVTFWGFSFVWVDQLLHVGMPPYTILVIRLGISAILLFTISSVFGKLQKPNLSDLKWIFLMALLEPFLYFIVETEGIVRTTPATASVVVSTMPLLGMLLSFLIYNERVSRINVLGAFVAVSGVTISLLNEEMSIKVDLMGLLMLLMAVFSAIGYSLVVKKMTAKYNPFSIVVFQNAMGAVMFLPLAFFEIDTLANVTFSINTMYPLLLLAIFPSTLAFVFHVNSVQRIGVGRTVMFTTLMPVVTLFFSAALGRELLNPRNLFGVILVIFGLMLSQMKKKARVPL
jgi:drug/metabolite transporter (DMT)-like permease